MYVSKTKTYEIFCDCVMCRTLFYFSQQFTVYGFEGNQVCQVFMGVPV